MYLSDAAPLDGSSGPRDPQKHKLFCIVTQLRAKPRHRLGTPLAPLDDQPTAARLRDPQKRGFIFPETKVVWLQRLIQLGSGAQWRRMGDRRQIN